MSYDMEICKFVKVEPWVDVENHKLEEIAIRVCRVESGPCFGKCANYKLTSKLSAHADIKTAKRTVKV